MRSAKADRLTDLPTSLGEQAYLCTGQSYLERLGVLYTDEIRLAILRACSMREMGRLEFFEKVGGSSYASIRRHFLKMEETGWLRKVRTVPNGRGRPEALYRATELAVINTETWRTIPASIRDTLSVMFLEDMASGLAEALEDRTLTDGPDEIAEFKVLKVDERSWSRVTNAVEHYFQTLAQEQIDAKVRLDSSHERPRLLVVHLGAFEVPGPRVPSGMALPKAPRGPSAVPWAHRIGRVFSDQLDMAIVAKLNAAAMTPEQLYEALGGESGPEAFRRRCKRLTRLGLAVNVKIETGGSLRGAKLHHFRAAAPNITADDILGLTPASARKPPGWESYQSFIRNSIAAIDAGTFNSRADRHLTTSTLLVDRRGWKQATEALRNLKATLRQLEATLAGRPGREEPGSFRAGFLMSGFQAPVRDSRP